MVLTRRGARSLGQTLLVQSLNDGFGTMLQLDEIALAAPHAQQLRLADWGHSPHRDQPLPCIEGVTDFVKQS